MTGSILPCDMRLGLCILLPEKSVMDRVYCSGFQPSLISSAWCLSFLLRMFPTLRIVSRIAISAIAKVLPLQIQVQTWLVPWVKRITAFGAMSKARIPARSVCGKKPGLMVLLRHSRKAFSVFRWRVALWMRKFQNSIRSKRPVLHWVLWLSSR